MAASQLSSGIRHPIADSASRGFAVQSSLSGNAGIRVSSAALQRQFSAATLRQTPTRNYRPLKVSASRIAVDGENWWEKNVPPNMKSLHSTQEFVAALGDAGEKLVVVEFFGTWCGSCRALYPKFCKLAAEHPDVLFFKIDFDANKPLCKSLNIRMLPFFHFYRGASGRLDAFSCSLSKLQKLRDALAAHTTERCELGPPAGPDQILNPEAFPNLPTSAPAPPPAATAGSAH